MNHKSAYIILLLIIFILGCKNEIPPSIENLSRIINSKHYTITIKCCHGGIIGKNHCYDEIIFIDKDTLKYQQGDKTYIRPINETQRDSLNYYYATLIQIHLPEKNIKKDGFGCTYHDYNYAFENESLRLTIKPEEGNGIYYRIQKLFNLTMYEDIISGIEYCHQLDSSELLLFTNQKITDVKKLISKVNNKETIAGLLINTTLKDKSFSIIPSPNPGLSRKSLSPLIILQDTREFSDFVVLPKRYIQSISEADTILNKILGLDILRVDFVLKLKDKHVYKSLDDPYGVRFEDRFIMAIYFENNQRIFIENKGLNLDVYE